MKDGEDTMEEVELVDARAAHHRDAPGEEDEEQQLSGSGRLAQESAQYGPDGDLDEHRPLRSQTEASSETFRHTNYISLDPTRRRSLGFGTGKWLVLAAALALLLALGGSLLAAFQPNTSNTFSQPRSEGDCQLSGSDQPQTFMRPYAYTLSLAFTSANFDPDSSAADHSFAANASISFTAAADTSMLLLHSVNLSYSAVSLKMENGEAICICGQGCNSTVCQGAIKEISSGSSCPPSGIVQLDLAASPLEAGQNATLQISYQGRLNPAGSGIYRSAVFNAAAAADLPKEESVLLVTQLEQTGARHLFPCVDEPGYKAVFTVELTYPAGLTGLSNTEIDGLLQTTSDGRMKQIHRPTPKMSTYLLAICIGKLTQKSVEAAGGINVAVWAVPGLHDQLELPLQISARAIEFYTNWTNFKQPLTKFDLVAVPGKQGAMENWGCLLFDENRFLWNQNTEGVYGKWLSADVICHEVAHQWFGNLATCSDWSQITVNEGMASFMEYLCVEAVLPELSLVAMFQRASSPMGEIIGIHEGPRATALLSDDEPFTSSLVPMLGEQGQPSLLLSGAIIYSKGASIMGMLQDYLEAQKPMAFQEGLKTYLQQHAYGSAKVDDIVSALLAAVHSDSASQAELSSKAQQLGKWFYQPGIPILNVSANASQVNIEQALYLVWSASNETNAAPWLIPLAIGQLGAPADAAIVTTPKWTELKEHSTALSVSSLPDAAWTVNLGGKGLFRVSYPTEQLQHLAAAIQMLPANSSGSDKDISAASALIDDAFSLLHQGLGSAAGVFQLAGAAAASPALQTPLGQHLLLGTILDRLQMLRLLLLTDETCTQDLESYILNLTASIIPAAIGAFQQDAGNISQVAPLTCLAQADLLRDAALSGSNAAATFLCSTYANTSLAKPLNSSSLGWISPDVRGAAYIAAAAQPDGCRTLNDAEIVWEELRSCWETVDDISESRRCLHALGYTRRPVTRQLTLQLLLDPNNLAVQMLSPSNSSRKQPTASDTIAILRILSRDRDGASAVWASIFSKWAALKANGSLWSILDQIPLLAEEQTVRQLKLLLDESTVRGQASVQQQRIVGRLNHNVQWVQSVGFSVCQFLSSQT